MASVRPVGRILGYDRGGRQVDHLGRRHPTRLTPMLAMRAVPGLAEQFQRTVPSEFWAEDADDEGRPVAIVACPCGEQPGVPLGSVVECECERFYYNLGKAVRVANSPLGEPEPKTVVEESGAVEMSVAPADADRSPS